MKVIYLKKIGFYALIPMSDDEQVVISEIAMVLRPGDKIYYRKHRSQKTGQNIFQTWSKFGSYTVRIDLTLSGITEEDNNNIENIVSHAFLPNNTFYLRFIQSIKVAGRWAIILCPRIRKQRTLTYTNLNAR